MLQEMTKLLPDLGASGFAGHEHTMAGVAQKVGEPLNLRGFAAAFAAFK